MENYETQSSNNITISTTSSTSVPNNNNNNNNIRPHQSFVNITIKDYFERYTHSKAITLVSLFMLLGLLSFWYLPLQDWWLLFLQWVTNLGDFAFVVYILVFIVSTVLCFPVGLLTVASGFIFGLWVGTLISWFSSLIGASLAFLLGQKLFQSCIEELALNYPRFSSLNKAVSQNGWKIVFLVRLSPLLPFNILNYLLSLTNIKFFDYLSATCVGLFIPTLLWVYLGSVAKDLDQLISNPSKSGTFVLLFGTFITVFSLIFITQISAKIIKKEIELSKLKEPTKIISV